MVQRRENGWHRDGCADGVEQVALPKPHLFAGQDIGGNNGQRDRQFLDPVATDKFLQGLHQHLAFQHAGTAPGDIQVAQDIEFGEVLHPLGIVVELASGIEAADQCPDGTAGDRADLPPMPLQRPDDADMRQAAGPTAAEYQGDCLTI